MAIFEWDNKYSVNIAIIDSHHKKLFDIVNNIYDLMEHGADDDSIIKIISELLDYTNYHFSEEEKMMEKINYPDISSHKREHVDFIALLTEYFDSAKNGKAIFVAVKLSDAGVTWLKNHILTTDTKYQKYIAANNLTV
ncbi:MAG: bacteriohemerythrin [Methylococcaceae bacterium]|nr:bacteriohemerythrin [Methylococcaceae bacterium]